MKRILVLLGATAILLGACGSSDDAADTTTTTESTTTTSTTTTVAETTSTTEAEPEMGDTGDVSEAFLATIEETEFIPERDEARRTEIDACVVDSLADTPELADTEAYLATDSLEPTELATLYQALLSCDDSFLSEAIEGGDVDSDAELALNLCVVEETNKVDDEQLLLLTGFINYQREIPSEGEVLERTVMALTRCTPSDFLAGALVDTDFEGIDPAAVDRDCINQASELEESQIEAFWSSTYQLDDAFDALVGGLQLELFRCIDFGEQVAAESRAQGVEIPAEEKECLSTAAKEDDVIVALLAGDDSVIEDLTIDCLSVETLLALGRAADDS